MVYEVASVWAFEVASAIIKVANMGSVSQSAEEPMAAEVRISVATTVELSAVPLPIQERIAGILERLSNWPSVSGAKPLRGELHGSYRIRTGDFLETLKWLWARCK